MATFYIGRQILSSQGLVGILRIWAPKTPGGRDQFSSSAFQAAPDPHGGGEILERRADRLEQCDLLRRGAALNLASAQIEQVALNVGGTDDTAPDRIGEVAALLEGDPRIDEDAGAPQDLV